MLGIDLLGVWSSECAQNCAHQLPLPSALKEFRPTSRLGSLAHVRGKACRAAWLRTWFRGLPWGLSTFSLYPQHASSITRCWVGSGEPERRDPSPERAHSSEGGGSDANNKFDFGIYRGEDKSWNTNRKWLTSPEKPGQLPGGGDIWAGP